MTHVAPTAKQGDQGTAALPYNFVFYLHKSQDRTPQQKAAAAEAATQQGGVVPDGLHKVSLTHLQLAKTMHSQISCLLPLKHPLASCCLHAACKGETTTGQTSFVMNKRDSAALNMLSHADLLMGSEGCFTMDTMHDCQ
jgi:hypothetical protein